MSNSSLAIPLSPVCPSVENAGRSAPIGATVGPGGVNFSIFSRYATAVELLFFDRDDDARPARVIPFDSAANRTYHYWHTFVPGAQPGQLYGYRVYGPFDPPRGLRFDPGKSSWTRTAAVWLFPNSTAAKPRASAATMPPPR